MVPGLYRYIRDWVQVPLSIIEVNYGCLSQVACLDKTPVKTS